MRTLVVVAHLDDETFGLGGTLLKMCNDNPNQVKIVSICNGRSGDNKSKRQDSFHKVVSKLGCHYEVYGFDDLTLEQIPLNKIADIIKLEVDEFAPDRVICTAIDDLHQDHVVVSRATRIACRASKVKQLLEFKIPGSSTTMFQIGVDISGVFIDKLKMCMYYETELKVDVHNPCSVTGIGNINKGDGTSFGMGPSEMLRLIWAKY